MNDQASKGRRRRWPLRLLLVVLAIGSAMVVYLAAFAWLPASVDYQITERYRFSSRERAWVALGVLLPVSRPSQTVDGLSVTWDGWQGREARDQVDVQTFMGEVSPAMEKVAVVSYHVALPQGPARWLAPVLDADLLPQPGIESDDLSIIANAASLAPSASREDALRIYRFVADLLSQPAGALDCADPSAVAALSSGQNGCGESANLMVALSRAAGIPARVIGGVAFPALSLGFPQVSQTLTAVYPGTVHAWVEFSTAGGWEMADPAWDLPGRPLFGRSDGAHLSYGEIYATQQTLADVRGWAAVVGHEISAMTTPPKFVASADQEGVTVTPVVTVQKGRDIRWLYLLAGLLLIALLFGLLDRLLVRRPVEAEDKAKVEDKAEVKTVQQGAANSKPIDEPEG